jgi:hypothetical protein
MAGETGLVDIKRLVLSDTFNTWFDTTNQIIDAIDPITVYGVQALTGVNIISGSSGGNYNGIKYFGLLPNHGVGYYGTNNEISLDYSGLLDGSGTPIVATGDYYSFTDISDTTQSAFGTIKRVRASNMLPSTINAPGGNINLEGNLTINGQLFVGGQNSFLASNDLRIEDKNIELAYQQAGFIGVTGMSSGSYPIVGATAYYFDPGITAFSGVSGSAAATVIGIVKSVTGPFFGPTAQIKIGSVFSRGGPELFTFNGNMKFSGTGSVNGGPTGATFNVVAVYGDPLSQFGVSGPTTEFFNDTQLNGAGFTIRGASGDKTFTWSTSQASLVSNVPLGVVSENQYINARYFRNYGLTTDNKNDFVFVGTSANSQNKSIAISYAARGKWAFEYDKSITGSETLVVKYATGSAATAYTLSTFNGLTTGPFGITSTAGGSANMWADGFNAEFVNGAGATFGSTPNSIPIADARGRINDQWLEASSTRTKITQSGHGLSAGSVVAIVGGAYVGANAATYTSAKAEAVGIVESVVDSDNFVIVSQGYISGVPNINSTNTVYFLSTTTDGGLTTNAPTLGNSVRKSIFYPAVVAGGSAAGYVLSYPGQIVGAGQTATDQVYLESIVPIGAIQQYAGSTDNPTYNTLNWIPCDGRAVSYQGYIDLYTSIGNTYYARGIVSSSAGTTPVITVERDTRGLEATDIVTLVVENGSPTGGTSWDAKVYSVNSGASNITLTGDVVSWATVGIGSNTPVRIYGKVDTNRGTLSTFFVPDLRTRIGVGSVTGEATNWLGGTFHGATFNTEGLSAGYGITGGTGSVAGGFLATNYLIRAIKNTSAVILTGHNHDDRYLLKTRSDTHSGTGITFAGSEVYNFASGTTPTLYINNSSGNVGVGTAQPTSPLHIVGGDQNIPSLLITNGYSSITQSSGGCMGLSVRAGNNTGTATLLDVGNSDGTINHLRVNKDGLYINGIISATGSVAGTNLKVIGGLQVTTPSGGNIASAFFTQPQFNSSSATNITQTVTLQPSLFSAYGSPSSVYTIDPGAGISVTTGNTLTIISGFTWKII